MDLNAILVSGNCNLVVGLGMCDVNTVLACVAHGVAELKNRPLVSKERTRSPELSMDEPSPRFRSPRNGSRDTPQREYHHTTNVHTDVTIPRAHSPAPMVVPSDSDRAMQAKSVTPEPPVIAKSVSL